MHANDGGVVDLSLDLGAGVRSLQINGTFAHAERPRVDALEAAGCDLAMLLGQWS